MCICFRCFWLTLIKVDKFIFEVLHFVWSLIWLLFWNRLCAYEFQHSILNSIAYIENGLKTEHARTIYRFPFKLARSQLNFLFILCFLISIYSHFGEITKKYFYSKYTYNFKEMKNFEKKKMINKNHSLWKPWKRNFVKRICVWVRKRLKEREDHFFRTTFQRNYFYLLSHKNGRSPQWICTRAL